MVLIHSIENLMKPITILLKNTKNLQEEQTLQKIRQITSHIFWDEGQGLRKQTHPSYSHCHTKIYYTKFEGARNDNNTAWTLLTTSIKTSYLFTRHLIWRQNIYGSHAGRSLTDYENTLNPDRSNLTPTFLPPGLGGKPYNSPT